MFDAGHDREAVDSYRPVAIVGDRNLNFSVRQKVRQDFLMTHLRQAT
jgi:hypothetical protein